jgi:muramoyltetrapeptide carboxypeptidase
VAASSPVPEVEFGIGVDHLRSCGFEVTVHPQVHERHFIYAGTDGSRAQALYDFARNDRFDVIWMARGGYSAQRILPLLEEKTAKHGPPARKKLLVGYSDVTVLHEFVRKRWGWSTLHAPMPAASNFSRLDASQWQAIVDLVHGRRPSNPWEKAPLRAIGRPLEQAIRCEVVGGNMCLWTCLVGTPWNPEARGKLLFLEDLGEPFYRIDRMLTQLIQAGALQDVRCIMLGDFTDCNDEDNKCLAPPPTGVDPRSLLDQGEKAPRQSLRQVFGQEQALREIFGQTCDQLGIPVLKTLPVGHGPNFAPLPLGATYELTPDGRLELLQWDWLE